MAGSFAPRIVFQVRSTPIFRAGVVLPSADPRTPEGNQLSIELIEQHVGAFLQNEVLLEPGDPPALDAYLLGGILDSLNVLRLAAFLEEEFQVSVGDGEVIPDNFGTIQSIARYVQRKRVG